MSIYIYLRKTEDWKNATYDTLTFPTWYENRSKVTRTIWSQCFHKPYCEFRGELKEICSKDWKYPVIIENIDELRSVIKEDDWVLPTDDDDFFHPDIGDFLVQSDPYEMVHWDSICNQTVYHFSTHAWHACHNNPCSNSYAIRGSVVHRYDNTMMKFLLEDHNMVLTRADKLQIKWKSFPKTQMSVYNWHIGSISLLMTVEESIDRMRSIIAKNDPPKIKPEWSWAERNVSEIVALVKGMKPKQPVKIL